MGNTVVKSAVNLVVLQISGIKALGYLKSQNHNHFPALMVVF